jgi:hypothetical protein
MSFEQVSDQPLFTGLTVQQKWYLYESNLAYLTSLASFGHKKMIFFQTGVWQIQLNLTIMAVLGYQKVVDVQRWLLLVVRLTVIMSFEQVSDQPLFTGLTVQQKWHLYESNSAY